MRRLLFYIFICLLPLGLKAQAPVPSKVWFSGLGRALVTHDELDGKVLQNDTTTPNRGTEGYALFDMGLHLQPYDYVRGLALIRLKTTFGSFYGQGASVEFRQVLLEGTIAKKVKYALGDIDVMMTPYTVFNSVDSSQAFEADVFKIRRNIVHYENFNVDNNWRMQGAKAATTMLINKTAARIRFDAFASRTRVTNNYSLPDRFLTGASMNISLLKSLKIGGNYVRFFETDKQLNNQETSYGNDVITGTLSYSLETAKAIFRLKGEGGASYFQRTISKDSAASKSDFFFDARAEAEIKPLKLKVYGGYKETGAAFYSPSAQTLRIDNERAPAIFPNVGNNLITREQLLYDRTTQEKLYNQVILPTLMPYLPQFGNALPYGEATPNRTGYMLGLNAGIKESLILASARADMLSEIIGEGTASLRRFLLLRAGTSLQLHKLLNSDRLLALSLGGKLENTSRNEPALISLQTSQADAGITAETIRNLDFMFGYKALFSKGNEFLAVRNSFNEITDYSTYKIDFAQQVLSGGFRYRFSDKSYFTAQGNFILNNNKLADGFGSYNLTQYFVTYNLGF